MTIITALLDTGQGSVTAFIDKNTGEVYKPASWKAPAKHVRFDLRIIREREFLHNPKNVTGREVTYT